MCDGPILVRLIAYSVPLMLTGVLQILYNAADMIIVGKFDLVNGKEALAAVGSTGSLINLLVNLFMGLSVGASVVVAQNMGAHKEKEVNDAVHTSMTISLIAGVVVGLCGFFAARPLLVLMDSPVDVLDLSALYLKIYFLGMPASMIYNYGASIMRGMGDTRRPLVFLTVSGIINVISNVIFVKYLHMSVMGVALATVISQIIAAALVTVSLMRADDCSRLSLKKLRIKCRTLWEIMRIGIPAGLQGSIFSFSNVLIQSSINSFASTAMAGSAASGSVEGIVYTCMNSVAQAGLTFTGQNYGAGNIKRIGMILRRCVLLVTAVGLIMGFGVYAAGPALLRLYNDDPAVVEMGMLRLGVIATTYCFCGLMDVFAGVMRGMGRSFVPMIVSLAGACGFRVLWIYTVFRMNKTLTVLYLSYPVSWILTMLVHLLCFLIIYSRVKRQKDSSHLRNCNS